jgi:hypothetical protein
MSSERNCGQISHLICENRQIVIMNKTTLSGVKSCKEDPLGRAANALIRLHHPNSLQRGPCVNCEEI